VGIRTALGERSGNAAAVYSSRRIDHDGAKEALMRNLRQRLSAAGAGVLATIFSIVGVVALGGTQPASGTMTANTQIFLTVDAYGTTNDLNWGQSVASGPNCTNVLGLHPIAISSVTGGAQGSGNLRFDPLVIKKSIDSATGPFTQIVGSGKAVNAHLYFFPVGGGAFDCTKLEMQIDLLGVTADHDAVEVPTAGVSSAETLTLNYRLEALRTASPGINGVYAWDTTGGFCWDTLKNAACNPASVPLVP
jgi:hypothetical protein